MATQLWAVLLVIAGDLVGSFGPILLKKASSRISFNLRSIIFNKYLIGGIFFYSIGTILFIPALRGGDLSVLYPFVALSYVWVSFLSMWFLKEKMNKLKWTGIALILAGVSLIGLGS